MLDNDIRRMIEQAAQNSPTKIIFFKGRNCQNQLCENSGRQRLTAIKQALNQEKSNLKTVGKLWVLPFALGLSHSQCGSGLELATDYVPSVQS